MVGKRNTRSRQVVEQGTMEDETENKLQSKRVKTSHQSKKSCKHSNDNNKNIRQTKDKTSKEPLVKVDGNKLNTKVKVVDKSSSELDFSETSISDSDKFVHTNNQSESSDPFLRELSQFGFKKTVQSSGHLSRSTCSYDSRNLIHMLEKCSLGVKNRIQFQKSVYNPVIELMQSMELYRTASPFDRRVTALEWHPTKQNILAVGSKGGDIILWDTENLNKEKLIQGIGAAGSCQAMKFWPWDTNKVVSASINGTVTLHDFELQQGTVLADTMNSYDHWYCSVDVNTSRYMIAAGRNLGILHLMSTEGRKVFEFKLHKNKITHVEFSPHEEWLLCTASTDSTVQLWDIRMIKDKKSAVEKLVHDKPVNSAYFSYTDGCRLLTTDQGCNLRVYQAPSWHLETQIEHPHRFFQHITPFKATWHPLQDLIVCGRYPDKNFPGSSGKELRTIDIFEAETGNKVTEIYNPGTDGLCPLNKFNWQGDALASGMGFHILLWNRKQLIARKQSMLMESATTKSDKSSSSSTNLASDPSRSRQRPRPPRKKKTNEDIDDIKKRVKSKTGAKTSVGTKSKKK